jgi:hypothetical protein
MGAISGLICFVYKLFKKRDFGIGILQFFPTFAVRKK